MRTEYASRRSCASPREASLFDGFRGLADQRDWHGKSGTSAEGGDAAAGLDGVADVADTVAEEGDGLLQVGRDEGETPEEGRAISAGALGRLRRLLDDLEDRRAEAEEGLPRRPGRRRLLSNSPKVEAGGGEGCDGAVEVGADRDDVVEAGDAV